MTLWRSRRCARPHRTTLPPLCRALEATQLNCVPSVLQAGIKCAAHNALRYHAKDRNNGSRSQHYDPRVPVDRDDFDETWVPLMDLSAEDCRAQVTVQVDHVDRDIRDVQMRFTDVAPKVFLQIRHAAGVSSREYADVLGKAPEPTTLPVSSMAEQ